MKLAICIFNGVESLPEVDGVGDFCLVVVLELAAALAAIVGAVICTGMIGWILFGTLHGLDDVILLVVDGDEIELVAAIVVDGYGGG